MQNQPYNYYSPRSNNLQNSYNFPSPQGTLQFLPPLNPLGQQTRQNHHFESNYNSRRTEDALDRFQKEQTAKPAFNQSQVSEQFQDPYQYSGSPARQPVSNDSYVNSPQVASPTKSNQGISSPRSGSFSPNPFKEGAYYGDAMDQTQKYTLHKPGHLSHLAHDIVHQQPGFSKKIEQSMKARSYNILSNQAQNAGYSEYAGMPYGYTIKALSKNQEPEKKVKALQAKGLDSSNYYKSSSSYGNFASPKQSSYQPNIFQNQQQPQGPVVAGKQNYYGETEFRYAHHPGNPDPLAQDQIYGIRALKNLSGVKLY